ncbi:uncharacterized protein LOC127565458 [Drosophila albomicans]|uniref:Uncharacterized protein LOC127565458 n=1 Tax=Drosophila albomicans TaxID=7291 RepID=A0A9C6T4Y2_DROAB|nr:uncharacterized protein LOC127565458 [Drosophila albomicans]
MLQKHEKKKEKVVLTLMSMPVSGCCPVLCNCQARRQEHGRTPQRATATGNGNGQPRLDSEPGYAGGNHIRFACYACLSGKQRKKNTKKKEGRGKQGKTGSRDQGQHPERRTNWSVCWMNDYNSQADSGQDWSMGTSDMSIYSNRLDSNCPISANGGVYYSMRPSFRLPLFLCLSDAWGCD